MDWLLVMQKRIASLAMLNAELAIARKLGDNEKQREICDQINEQAAQLQNDAHDCRPH